MSVRNKFNAGRNQHTMGLWQEILPLWRVIQPSTTMVVLVGLGVMSAVAYDIRVLAVEVVQVDGAADGNQHKQQWEQSGLRMLLTIYKSLELSN